MLFVVVQKYIVYRILFGNCNCGVSSVIVYCHEPIFLMFTNAQPFRFGSFVSVPLWGDIIHRGGGGQYSPVNSVQEDIIHGGTEFTPTTSLLRHYGALSLEKNSG